MKSEGISIKRARRKARLRNRKKVKKVDVSFDPHTHARSEDPVTSKMAAYSIDGTSTAMVILRKAYNSGKALTALEASIRAGYENDGGHKRVSDLIAYGFIERVFTVAEPDGVKRANPGTKRRAYVYRITASGREQLGD